MKNIVVVGLGYVGLPLALLADEKGYDVIGYDVNHLRVEEVNNRADIFADPRIHEGLRKSNLNASTDPKVIASADIVLICVPTPVHDRTPDLSILISATETVSKYVRPDTLIVIESTINPGVCDETLIPIVSKELNTPAEFVNLAHCPERINPGDKKWHVGNINRVLGANNNVSLQQAYSFYSSILAADVVKMDNLKEAEAVKIVENSFRNINIAFVNELAMSFDTLGINIKNVITGASSKPFAFMPHFPSCGVGGHCIPVDPHYLIDFAKGKGFTHRFLQLATQVNDEMPRYLVNSLFNSIVSKEISHTPAQLRFGILGLSYKANINDDRESPSYAIISELNKREAEYEIFDPYLKNKSTVGSIEELLGSVDAVIIASAHNEFRKINIKDLKDNNIKIIADGKNMMTQQAIEALSTVGIEYVGIGTTVKKTQTPPNTAEVVDSQAIEQTPASNELHVSSL